MVGRHGPGPMAQSPGCRSERRSDCLVRSSKLREPSQESARDHTTPPPRPRFALRDRFCPGLERPSELGALVLHPRGAHEGVDFPVRPPTVLKTVSTLATLWVGLATTIHRCFTTLVWP